MSDVYTQPDFPVWKSRHPQAKLYWRVKDDGKWKWIAAEVAYEGGYAIMVNYLLVESEPQIEGKDSEE